MQQLQRENEILRMERAILKKSEGALRQGIELRCRFIEAESASYSIVVLCRLLEVGRNGFYA